MRTNKSLNEHLFIALFSIFFAISLLMSLVFEFASTFSAPTASYALLIEENGNLSHEASYMYGKYWKDAVEVETYYPLPAILLAVFSIVTEIPKDLLMFIPIRSLANVIFFVFAKRILYRENETRGLFFALIYYAFIIMAYSINGGVITRATLGVTFLAYFIYSLMLLLNQSLNGKNHLYASGSCLITIFTLAIGFSYYSSLLSVLLIALILPIIARKFIRVSLSTMHICIISLAIIIYQPFYYSLIKAANLESFLTNILEYIKAQLKLETTGEAFELTVGHIELDLFTRVTGIWFRYLLTLLTGLAVLYVCLKYLVKKNHSNLKEMILWTYSLTVLLVTITELAYTFFAQTLSPRAIIVFGTLVLIYIIGNTINRTHSSFTSKDRINVAKKVVGVLILVIVLLSCIGSLSNAWFYGLSKPFGFKRASPILTYIVSYSSEEPIAVTSDAYYSALGLFHSTIFSKCTTIAYEPLLRDTFTLEKSLSLNNSASFSYVLGKRGITYFLFNNDLRPIWGDEWGYAIQLKDSSPLKSSFSIIYDDKNFYLIKVN